jgi:hypothetical protein
MLNEPKGFGQFDPVIFGLRFNIDGALSSAKSGSFFPLVWRATHFGPGPEHAEYLRASGDENNRFDAIAYFSLRVHESRHFHDLLATPYGCVLMRQYFRTAILGQSLMPELVLRTKSIFVPVTEWTLNPGFFARQFADLRPPSARMAWFSGVISTMKTKLDAFNAGVTAPSTKVPGLNAVGILEGSAITSQELHIEETYGADAATLFRRRVIESPIGMQYYGVRLFLQQISDEAVPAGNFLALCLCSLCGDFQDPEASHARYPADLLLEMIVWMREIGFRVSRANSPEDVIEAADRFFREAHGRSLIENLKTASVTNFKTLQALRQDAKQLGREGARAATEDLLSGFENFATAYEGEVRRVFGDLNGYCGLGYSRELTRHVEPAFFLESEYGIPLTSELDKVYYVGAGAGIRGDPEKIAVLVPQSRAELWPDGSYRTAFLMAPKSVQRTRQSGSAFIDLELWQKNFEHSEMIRFLTAGGTGNIPESQQWAAASTLAAGGTKVFSISGEMAASKNVDFERHIGPGANRMVAQIRRFKEGL